MFAFMRNVQHGQICRQQVDSWLPGGGKRGERGLAANRYRASFWGVGISDDGYTTPDVLKVNEVYT